MSFDVNQSPGNYNVKVDTVDLIEKGSELIVRVRIRFEDGEVGTKDLMPLHSEKWGQITRKSLSAMGFDMDARDLGEFQKNPSVCKGAEVQVTVEENDYKGNITNRVAWINAIPKPASKSILQAANERLKNAKKENLL